MPLKTVEPQRLYRQIAQQLRGLIARGEFAAGARLPAERDLAAQLGVSRPSVREALIALEVEGVIDVRIGSGIYVVERSRPAGAAAPSRQARHADRTSEWGPLQLIRARELVEGEVAALAARHASQDQVAEMARALRQMQEDAARGVAPRAGDEAFHNAVAQACGNEVLRDTVREYGQARSGPLSERLGDYFDSAPSWRAAMQEHGAVLKAIRAGDPAAARRAMRAHLKKAHQRFSAGWSRANTETPEVPT